MRSSRRHPPRTTPSTRGRRRPADVPERAGHAARVEQHRAMPVLSGERAGRPEGRPLRVGCEHRIDAGSNTRSNVGHGLQAVPPSRAAVLVMPQWNSDAGGHVGLCKLLAWNGMSALRLSLPYHDQRMPPELHRADYIVSANVMRTLQVCRQAVLDARRAIAWLKQQGYDAHRHSRHQPRLVPRAADDGARAADRRGGAQSHLAVFRRRRLARPVDRARARGTRTATSSSICCDRSGSRSARAATSSACATARRCWSTRGTT